MPNSKPTLIIDLYDLAITPESNKCFARVINQKHLKLNDLVKIAVSRRTEYNASTFHAVMEILNEVVTEEILNGASVNFGPGVFKLGVNGTFDPENPEWNSNEHKIVLQVSPTTDLYNKMEDVDAKVRGMASVKTSINHVSDLHTGTRNEYITRGNILELNGKKLKIAGDNPANGITLTNVATGKVTWIRAENLSLNFPKKIQFIVPLTLEPGDYQLEISTQFSNASTLTKKPRSYRLNHILKAE